MKYYTPSTYKSLVEAIRSTSDYTHKDIRKVYTDVVNVNLKRPVFYKRRAGIKRLQGFYFSLQKKRKN